MKSMSVRVASSHENSTSEVKDGAAGRLDHLLTGHPQLVLEMNVGGGDEGVDARVGGLVERVDGRVDVLIVRARQRGDDAVDGL